MYLTQTAEYALRAMAYMSTMSPDTPIRAQDLSSVVEIPSYYLSKILRKLVTAGLLESQKGHGGGFTFALPLDQIRFADILRAMDYEINPTKCVFGWGKCSPEVPCPLHDFWSDLKDYFVKWAEKYSMQDVRDNNGAIPAFKPNQENLQ